MYCIITLLLDGQVCSIADYFYYFLPLHVDSPYGLAKIERLPGS